MATAPNEATRLEVYQRLTAEGRTLKPEAQQDFEALKLKRNPQPNLLESVGGAFQAVGQGLQQGQDAATRALGFTSPEEYATRETVRQADATERERMWAQTPWYQEMASYIPPELAAAPFSAAKKTGGLLRGLNDFVIGAGLGAAEYQQDPMDRAIQGGLAGALSLVPEPLERAARRYIPGLKAKPQGGMPAPITLPPRYDAPGARAAGGLPEGLPPSAALPPPGAPAGYYTPEFNIPLTRGQSSGNLGQQQLEQRIKHGAFGEGPRERLGDILGSQNTGMQTAMRNIQTSATGGAPLDIPPSQLAGEFGEKLSQRAQTKWDTMKQHYKTAEGAGVKLRPQGYRNVVNAAEQAVNIDELRPNLYPAAHEAKKILQDAWYPLEAFPADLQDVDLKAVEQLRRDLSMLARDQNYHPEDRGQVGNMLGAIDATMEGLADADLVAGSREGIDALQAGIKTRREYGAEYGARGQRTRGGDKVADKAGQVIDKITSPGVELDSDQVLADVYGRSGMGNKTTAAIFRRVGDVAGRDSPEYKALQSIFWERFKEGARQRGAEQGQLSVRRFDEQWKKLRNDNQALLDQVMDRDTQGRMTRFLEEARKTEYMDEAQNRPKTAHMLESIMRSSPGLGAAIGGIAGSAGGPIGAAAGVTAGAVSEHYANVVRGALGKLFTGKTFAPNPPRTPLVGGYGLAPVIGASAARELLPEEVY